MGPLGTLGATVGVAGAMQTRPLAVFAQPDSTGGGRPALILAGVPLAHRRQFSGRIHGPPKAASPYVRERRLV